MDCILSINYFTKCVWANDITLLGMIIIFSFIHNGKIWNWERKFHNTKDINETVDSYLTNKILPFEITKEQIKWKLKT